MSDARAMAAGVLAIARRDAELFFSYRLRPASQAVTVLFSVVFFYYVSRLVRVEGTLSPDAWFGTVVVGLVVLELVAASLTVAPAVLRSELVAGTFERMAVSAFGPRAAVLALAAFPTLLALVLGMLSVGLAAALFGLDVDWPGALLAPPAALLVSLAFVPFNLLVAAALLLVKQAGGAAAFLLTGLSLTSGAFFPTSLLPGYVAWIADVQPLTPSIDLLREIVLPSAAGDPPWLAVTKLIGFTAILSPLAMLALTAAIARARARGTLTEY